MKELMGSILNCLVSAYPLLQCAPSRAGLRRRLEQATGTLVTSFLCASTLMLTVACIFIVGLPEYNEVTINTSCSCEQVQFLKYIEVIKIIYQENG